MGIINRTHICKSKDNILNLYKSIVRPHLEYLCQACRPYLMKDVDNIEKVQRHMTKIIPGISRLSYEERLCRTNLLCLEMRRLQVIDSWFSVFSHTQVLVCLHMFLKILILVFLHFLPAWRLYLKTLIC